MYIDLFELDGSFYWYIIICGLSFLFLRVVYVWLRYGLPFRCSLVTLKVFYVGVPSRSVCLLSLCFYCIYVVVAVFCWWSVALSVLCCTNRLRGFGCGWTKCYPANLPVADQGRPISSHYLTFNDRKLQNYIKH